MRPQMRKGFKTTAAGLMLATLSGGLMATAPLAAASAETLPSLSAERLETHVRILADDAMEGRQAGHAGYDRAANYVAEQFRALGLKPAGDDPQAAELGGYFQKVTLQGAKRVAKGASLRLTKTLGKATDVSYTLAYKYPEKFIVGASMNEAETTIAAPLVFAGFGIDAPERGHNDYAGLDVKGKIVVLLSGTPKGWPSEIAAYYGSAKAETAARLGAVGIITVGTKESEERRPYKKALDYLDSESMTWVAKDGKPFVKAPEIRVSAALSPEAAKDLFDGAPKSYAQILEEAEKGAPKGFALPGTAEIAQQSTHRTLASANVAAILEGSDPALKGEYVVLTAHLDGLGIGKKVDGDKIYNGAMDNATGIATLIETARAFVESGERSKRSVMFLAVTAEEKGLVGADYYARTPTVPKEKIVANVNLDMPVLLYPFKDLVAFGAQHSTLGDTVAKAAAQAGIALSPDPLPEEAIFVRSDHYRFVQQGIPSVMLMPGFQSADPSKDGGKLWHHFLTTDYHRPSDDMKQGINFQAGKLFAEVNYVIARDIANAAQRPTWLPGNFFGEKYAPQMAAATAAHAGHGQH